MTFKKEWREYLFRQMDANQTYHLCLFNPLTTTVDQCSSSPFQLQKKKIRDGGDQTSYVCISNFNSCLFKLFDLLSYSYSFHHRYMKTISFTRVYLIFHAKFEVLFDLRMTLNDCLSLTSLLSKFRYF